LNSTSSVNSAENLIGCIPGKTLLRHQLENIGPVELAATESIESHVRLLIMKNIESGTPNAALIARQMGISLSTFKRRLARVCMGNQPAEMQLRFLCPATMQRFRHCQSSCRSAKGLPPLR
jgi:hypothetical protein